MKNKLLIILSAIGITFGSILFASAAPVSNLYRSIIPETTDTYYVGTSTPSTVEYNGIFTKNLTVSGTCTGCGSGGSGAISTSSPLTAGLLLQSTAWNTIANIATSSLGLGVSSFASSNISQWTNNAGYITSIAASPLATSSLETAGQLPYWTTTSGFPAKLGTVATTSLTASSPLSLSQPISVIGSSASSLTIATTTTSLFSGTPGQVLGYMNGGWFGVATTTFNSPLVYSNGSVSCATCLTANQSITLSGAVSGSGTTAITTSYAGTLGNTLGGTGANSSAWSGLAGVSSGSWYQIATSSPLNTSITGNSATVTTNADLSGVVTSSGNTTSFGTTAVANSVLANITGGSAVPAFIATSTLFTYPWSVANGGTGAITLTGCLTGNGTGAITGSGTCNTSNATVSSITGGLGLSGGTITTSGTLSLISYLATSTSEVAGNLAYWATTGGTPAKLNTVATSSISLSAGLTNTGGTLGSQVGGTALTLGQIENRSFSYATSTAWTATTTIPLGLGYGETWNNVKCFTDAGTLYVDFYHATTHFNKIVGASTTVGIIAMGATADTAGDKVYVDIGNPASSPTEISCTVNDTN